MKLNEQPPNNSVTQLFAAMTYLIFGTFVYIPIAYLMAKVSPELTILIFIMLFIQNVSKIYLGIK